MTSVRSRRSVKTRHYDSDKGSGVGRPDLLKINPIVLMSGLSEKNWITGWHNDRSWNSTTGYMTKNPLRRSARSTWNPKFGNNWFKYWRSTVKFSQIIQGVVIYLFTWSRWTPINTSLKKVNPIVLCDRQQVRDQIQNWSQWGTIRTNFSKYQHPLVAVRKKNPG